MNFYAITALVNLLTTAFLGFFVYANGRKKTINVTFSLFCLSVVIWSVGYFIWQTADMRLQAFVGHKFLMVAAIFVPILYFHFASALVNKEKEKKKWIWGGYVIFSAFLVANFTPFFVKGVEKRLFFNFWPVPGPLFHPFLALFFIYGFYSALLLLKASQSAEGDKRVQYSYVFWGTIIGFLGGSTNYLLWYNIPIPPFGNILVSVGILIIAYGVLRHHVFGIKALLTQFLVAIFIIFLAIPLFDAESKQDFYWHLGTLIFFLVIGAALIREVLREVKDKERIKKLDAELIEKKEKLREAHWQVAEERAQRLEKVFMENINLKKEIEGLQMKVEELKNKVRR